jgi:hypothetical protein
LTPAPLVPPAPALRAERSYCGAICPARLQSPRADLPSAPARMQLDRAQSRPQQMVERVCGLNSSPQTAGSILKSVARFEFFHAHLKLCFFLR